MGVNMVIDGGKLETIFVEKSAIDKFKKLS